MALRAHTRRGPEQLSSLPLAALTAWQALVDHAGLTCGETVLVHGGAGGVGVYAVQLAAGLGARVIATDLPANAEFVRRLGAERFVDFITEEFDRTTTGLDVVLDTVGPVVSQTFPLAEGRRACESGGHTRRPGKTVLVVRSSG